MKFKTQYKTSPIKQIQKKKQSMYPKSHYFKTTVVGGKKDPREMQRALGMLECMKRANIQVFGIKGSLRISREQKTQENRK